MSLRLHPLPVDPQRLYVAYSGGLDSSVLLHLLLESTPSCPVVAWHFNHGLVDSAAEMEAFCVAQAQAYGIEIRVDHLQLDAVTANLEAEARSRRYALLDRHCRAGEAVVTAHHADDQAETFLLNALRGSGTAGLRGIARQRRLGDGWLVRPLIDYTREQLEQYASQHELAWFNDPSNRDLRFDRNFLRHEVFSRLKSRWPHCINAVSNAADLQVQTQTLLDEVAAEDLAAVTAGQSGGIETLGLEGLRQLSDARCKNLLRYWISQAGMAPLPQARLLELLRQLHARPDAMPKIEMPEYDLRIYDQRLFIVPRQDQVEIDDQLDFEQRVRVEVESLGIKLSRAEIFSRLQIEDRNQSLTLKFRRRGQPSRDSHRLKRLFQKHRIPPWERGRVPQVYLDGKLEGILR